MASCAPVVYQRWRLCDQAPRRVTDQPQVSILPHEAPLTLPGMHSEP
jgi:hypothetical protein